MMADNKFENVVNGLSKAKDPVCVTAAAGCGKTTAIAQAVAKSEGRQLILTHTHAGVAALRSRLQHLNVSPSKYRIATIASWLLKYVLAYSSMSGFSNPRPSGKEWEGIYPAARELFEYPFIKEVLQASYAGVFVDEYQDCTKSQHEVIKKLGDYLPLRVLGDPLQGIFAFDNNPLVEWEKEIKSDFYLLGELVEPYRWKRAGGNSILGEQLSEIRQKLLRNQEIDLTDYSEITWKEWSENNEIEVLEKFSSKSSVAGIHTGKWEQLNTKKVYLDHITARQTQGKYQCIEEMDCRSMMFFAKDLDGCRNDVQQMRKKVIHFLLGGIAQDQLPQEIQQTIRVLNRIEEIPEIIKWAIKNVPVFRRELFTEMQKAIEVYSTGRFSSLEEAAYITRNRTRVNGRKIEGRIISRTLLIKGLEFDHAVVLNADKLQNRENFYVAITRGSQSLTILSSSPIYPLCQG